MTGWFRTTSSRMLLELPFLRVREDDLEMADGQTLARTVVELDDAVGVVPLFDDGTVVFVRQYRHPFARSLLEIPAGKLDVEGESIEDAAARELAEEVGLAADRMERLLTFANSAGGTDEQTHLYLATGLRQVAQPDDFEPEAEEAHMEIVRLPLDDAVAAVVDGTITDAKTVIALLLLDARA